MCSGVSALNVCAPIATSTKKGEGGKKRTRIAPASSAFSRWRLGQRPPPPRRIALFIDVDLDRGVVVAGTVDFLGVGAGDGAVRILGHLRLALLDGAVALDLGGLGLGDVALATDDQWTGGQGRGDERAVQGTIHDACSFQSFPDANAGPQQPQRHRKMEKGAAAGLAR